MGLTRHGHFDAVELLKAFAAMFIIILRVY